MSLNSFYWCARRHPKSSWIVTMTVACTIILFAWTDLPAQQTFKVTPTSVIAYLEYLPQNYNTNSNKYPVVIFLHGIGERGPNTTDTTVLKQSINDVTRNGPPLHVKNGTQFPFILISPQLKNNYGDWPSAYVMEVIEHCKTYLRIDEKRIYLTGLSLGGGGTWWTAQDYPKMFAAIAPVCGSRNTPSKACNLGAENLPVWAFHGTADAVVSVTKSQTMINAINACVPVPSPLAKLTLYIGIGHDSWTNAYKTDHSVHNPNVYEWLMEHTNQHNAANALPAANAGVDKSVSTSVGSLTINGSAADPDGTIASYTWTKLSGPSVTIANASSASVTLTSLQAGQYIFRLQVTDNSGNTDSDYVRVTVNANANPTVNAGPDQSIILPENAVTLTGSASDSDGTITSTSWQKVSGGNAVLTVNGMSLSATSLEAGTYIFRLTATDNTGATSTDDVSVTVNSEPVSAPAPAPPVLTVNAGADKIVRLPTSSATLMATVVGTGDLTYQWQKVSGGNCTMLYTNTSKLLVKYLASGKYTFRVTVTDSFGTIASDDITITVDAPPVVNAGTDVTVTQPANSVTLKGSATDADGSIVKYQWSKYSGPTVKLSGTSSSATVTYTNLVAGTYVFKLAATDDVGVTGIDYVTVTVLPGSSL